MLIITKPKLVDDYFILGSNSVHYNGRPSAIFRARCLSG